MSQRPYIMTEREARTTNERLRSLEARPVPRPRPEPKTPARRPRGMMEAVLCTVDGGSAGSDTTTCDFTYTITTLGGTELATTLTPKRPRYANVTYNTPTTDSIGQAYKDSAGDWQLYEAIEEYPTLDSC